MLELTRQRVYQIIASDETFPEPIDELTVGRIWRRADIERWAKKTGRLQ